MKDFIAYFTFFFDMAALTVLLLLALGERKKRKEQENAETQKYNNIRQVRSIVIDSHGFLAIIPNPGDPLQHIFCRRLESFCSTSCQFFNNADNHFDEKRPCFDCWMLPDMYAAPERIDWRNARPDCAPEKKP